MAQKLSGHAASIRVLDLPGLPLKGDVSDWLATGGTRQRLEELAAEAPYWQPGGEDTFDQVDDQAEEDQRQPRQRSFRKPRDEVENSVHPRLPSAPARET